MTERHGPYTKATIRVELDSLAGPLLVGQLMIQLDTDLVLLLVLLLLLWLLFLIQLEQLIKCESTEMRSLNS